MDSSKSHTRARRIRHQETTELTDDDQPDRPLKYKVENIRVEVLDHCDAIRHYKRLQREAGLPTQVLGFNFPIADEDTVELLEATVNVNEDVRTDYINYLRARKPATVGLINVFHMLFTDEAMYSYNYSGVCNRGSKRKAMQHYSIFMGCMLEAWEDHGLDETTLKENIYQVIRNINGRKRNRKYFAKRREQERMKKMASEKE